MKKSARVYTEHSRSGFTLVELLVVVAIIAVLSVIGITIFSGVQKGARDATRKADVNAIAKAMEANKTSNSSYPAILDTYFAAGKIPTDPNSPSRTYCMAWGDATTALPAAPAVWTGACAGSYAVPSNGGAGGFSAPTSWRMCASMEASSAVYCLTNSQ